MTTNFARFLHELVEQKKWLSLVIIFAFVLTVFGSLGNGIKEGINLVLGNKMAESSPADTAKLQQPVLPVERESISPSAVVAGAAINHDDYAFKESDWDLNTSVVKQKETGFYCVRERKSFEGGEIWYHEKLKIGEVVKIRFSLKPDESVRDATQSPKLILLYGRKEDKSSYYRMFVPDVDINFIGFENASSQKRISPSHLLRPLNFSDAKEIELEYSVGSAHSNDALFQYKLSYVPSSDDGKQVTDDGSFQSSFPWPNAKDTEQEFGIGAFNGTCFRIISFSKEP